MIAAIIHGVFASNHNRGKIVAIMESVIPNACYAIGDGDGSKPNTTIESTFPNAGYAIRDSDGCKRGATLESTLSNTCYAIRNSDGAKRNAIIESERFNTRYGVLAVMIHYMRRDRYVSCHATVICVGYGGGLALFVYRIRNIVNGIVNSCYHDGRGILVGNNLN